MEKITIDRFSKKDQDLIQRKKERNDKTYEARKHDRVVCDVCYKSIDKYYLPAHKKTIKCRRLIELED